MEQTLGRYQIIEIVGQGGMATVYRAYDPTFDRDVAIKIVSPQAFGVTAQARFNLEVRILARLAHSAIMPIYDFGVQGEQLYYTMAYMSGGSLTERMSQEVLSERDVIRILDRISAALDVAHRANVIHRDIKPANILFDQYGDAYLSDFGVVKLIESTTKLTASELLGTPAYMAPEIGNPDGITPLLDVYALGVTLFQMLSGELPYQADTPVGMIAAHMSQPVPNILVQRPDLPPAVQQVMEKALAKDPKMRFQSAGELASAARSVLMNNRENQPTSSELTASNRRSPQAASFQKIRQFANKIKPLYLLKKISAEPIFVRQKRIAKHRSKHIQFLRASLLLLIVSLAVVAVRPRIFPAPNPVLPNIPQEMIAYMYATRDGDHYGEYFLSVMNPEDRLQIPITDSFYLSPRYVWSPDGKRLAAFSYSSQPTAWIKDAQTNNFIVIISLDGRPTVIREVSMPLSDPVWSPDGSLLAYDCREQDICLLSTDGSKEKVLETDLALFSSPQSAFSWSLDGKRLLYSCDDAHYNAAICMSDLTIPKVRLIDYPGDDMDPTWSPEGTRFAFISQYDRVRPQETFDGNGIFVTSAEGTATPQKIADLPDGNYFADNLTWSPDGKYLALTGEDLAEPDKNGEDLIVVAADGSMSRIIKANALIRGRMSWSPDSTTLLYSGKAGQSTDIFLLSVATGNSVNLTDDPSPNDDPAWSPDGHWIVFTSQKGGNKELYRMDISGKNATRLTYTTGDEFGPVLWSQGSSFLPMKISYDINRR